MAVKIRASGTMTSVNVESQAAGYTAQGVTFPNSPYLQASAPLSVADGTTFLCSFWFKLLGNDGAFQIFFEQDSAAGCGFAIIRFLDDTLLVQANKSDTNATMVCRTAVTYTAGGGWHHVAATYDGATAPLLYIDGATSPGASLTHLGGTINFATPTNSVFGSRGGAISANADFADVWIGMNQYLDISVASNLQKFRSAGGAPVDLGATGATPTGTAPTVFFASTVASWHVNKGLGGNLYSVTNGPLAAASANPP